MNSRIIELEKLDFKRNEDQKTYSLYKYGESYFVDFHKITTDFPDIFWQRHIENIKYMLKQAKITVERGYKCSESYNFAQKEFKKEIKDKYNHYNSKLKEATKTKLDRRGRTEYIIKLESKVELLKELMK
jgi:hypothetical protein